MLVNGMARMNPLFICRWSLFAILYLSDINLDSRMSMYVAYTLSCIETIHLRLFDMDYSYVQYCQIHQDIIEKKQILTNFQ